MRPMIKCCQGSQDTVLRTEKPFNELSKNAHEAINIAKKMNKKFMSNFKLQESKGASSRYQEYFLCKSHQTHLEFLRLKWPLIFLSTHRIKTHSFREKGMLKNNDCGWGSLKLFIGQTENRFKWRKIKNNWGIEIREKINGTLINTL